MSYTNRTFSIAKKGFDKYNLVYLTWSRFENDWPSTMHFHAFTEFMYIVNGEGKLLLENGEFIIKEGDVVMINPSTPHTETSQTQNCLEYYIFAIENISFELTSENAKANYENVFIYNIDSLDGRKLLLALFKRIESELTMQKNYYEVYAQSLINEALIYILRKTNVKDVEYESTAAPRECAFVKRFIDLHFAEKLTLEDIAKKTFFSKFYVIHSFKKQYGITPIQYLLSKRLEEAAVLLKTTNMSVTSVCSGIGFSSPSQFARAFKEKYGITPQNFRKDLTRSFNP